MDKRVLIVGAGPVGLTVAIQLARYGIAADLIEKGVDGSSYSKALSVSAASLKAMHGLGLSEELHTVGKPIKDIQIFFNGNRTAHIDKRRLHGLYDYYLSLAQPETESLLRTSLLRWGRQIMYGRALTELRQTMSGVVATITGGSDGKKESKFYDFVIGCDGAQSAVRRLSNINFDGYDYDVHFVMGDVYFENKINVETTTYHVQDDGFLIFLPMAHGLTRLVVSRPGHLPAQRPVPEKEELQYYLDRYHRSGLKIDSVRWSSAARFFNRLANTNHQDCVFLAGDAFHLFSPIGGQGMNTGIQDAMNLSWKLAYFLQRHCNSKLLDTYRSERFTAVRKAADLTARNTEIILCRPDKGGLVERYMPKMANRSFFRNHLAQQFSGFLFDHNREHDSLIGKHVPYCVFPRAEGGIHSTYEIPLIGRNILYVSTDVSQRKLDELIESYSEVLQGYRLDGIINRDAIGLLDLVRNDACVVRPDGYIGFSGSFSECSEYFKEFYSYI